MQDREKLARDSEKKFGRAVRNTILDKSREIGRLWSLMELLDPNGQLASSVGCVALAGKPNLEGYIEVDQLDVEAHNKVQREQGMPERVLPPEFVAALFEKFGVLDINDGGVDDVKSATGVIFTPYQLVEVAFAAGEHYATELANRKGLAPLLEKSEDKDTSDAFDADEDTNDGDSDEEVEEDEGSVDDDDDDFADEDFDDEDDQD
jgi:hypothetical protein